MVASKERVQKKKSTCGSKEKINNKKIDGSKEKRVKSDDAKSTAMSAVSGFKGTGCRRANSTDLRSAIAITSKSNLRTGREPGEKTDQNIQEELFRLIGKSLTQNQWYHGLMPRQDCEDLLKNDGDFLVRKTTVSKAPTYCISVLHKGECKHIPVHFVNNNWTLKDMCKPTLSELIDFLVESNRPIPPSGAELKKTIPRPEYYILHDNVTVTKKLGAGAFGEVFTGLLKRKIPGNTNNEEEEVKVAVKKIKGAVTKAQLSEFVKEAKLMRRFDHANIVRLYGIAPQEEPIMIILEMAEGGSLKGFCEKNPSVPGEQLITWATDGARGMTYLSGRAVKLDKLKSMPIKWLAPETLSKGVFSTKTDVWSFGILLWELFARCKTDPFPGENNQQARLKILSGKDPMEPPAGTPEVGIKAMKLCFTQEPEKRPEFVGIFKLFAPNEDLPQPLQPWETYVD